MRLIDPELLRTFLAFADSGSLARAGEVVARSPSAVTAQMQRLEEIVGEPLLAASGRGRVLTQAGHEFLAHARRVIEVNREIWLSISGARADGRITLGTTQDFSATVLTGLLRVFARTHPRVRLELRIGRSCELSQALDKGTADVVIAMGEEQTRGVVGVIREPMRWLGSAEGLAVAQPRLPLALLDPPCGFRTTALAALDAPRIPFRIAASSASLSGLCTVVRAGVAITLRTARLLDPTIVDVSAAMNLPDVPDATFSVRQRADADPVATSLAGLLCDTLDAANPQTLAQGQSDSKPGLARIKP